MLRGALLGAGHIALRGHAPHWRQAALRGEAEIVAVADLSEPNREAARRLFPAATVYDSAEELLGRERIDFCDVCTPPFTRVPIVRGAAGRGIHLLCEKPIALGLADAEIIAAEVRGAGIVFKPCHQYHHSPLWQAVVKHLPDIGRVHLARYEVRRTAANEGSASWQPSWRTTPALAGGGILVDHGSHVFYQLRSVMGEARRIRATVRTLRHRAYEVEDTASVLLDHDDAVAEVSLTWAAGRREICFRLVGAQGEIAGDEHEVRVWNGTEETVVLRGGLSRGSSHSEWYAPVVADFLGQIRDGVRSREDLDEAVYVARVISSAYESSRALAVRPLSAAPASAAAASAPELAVATMGSAPGDGRGGPPKRWPRALVTRALAAAAVAGVATWMLHDLPWAQVWTVLSAADPRWVAAAAAVNLGVVFFQTLRWLALIRPLAPRATLASALKAMMTGAAVSTFVPARAGELARIEIFGREVGLPRAAIMGSVVLDHLVNASIVMLGLLLLPFVMPVPLWLRPGGWLAAAFFAIGAVAVLALRPVAAHATSLPLGGGRLRLRDGPASVIAYAREGLRATREPQALAWSLAACLSAWALEVNVTTLSMRAVGLRLPLGSTLFVLLAVNLALALPVAMPANLGTLEVGAVLALLELGVPKGQAVAFALSYHLLQVIPITVIGSAMALGGLGRRPAPAPSPLG
jgi:predicted dehydrogenase/uncharacterized membrane protein YbhN (UPF0104 family)